VDYEKPVTPSIDGLGARVTRIISKFFYSSYCIDFRRKTVHSDSPHSYTVITELSEWRRISPTSYSIELVCNTFAS
jgi:hypothetical protein